MDRCYAPLYRFAYSMSGCEATASDLTQQTFYLWATKGHQLQDSSKAKSWLFTTLRREYLQSRRRTSNHPHVELEGASPDLPAVQPEVVRHSSVAEVLRALDEIDEHYRTPLTLFHIQGLSYKEIAEVTETPIGTVMSQISRGRRKITEILQDRTECESESPVIPFKRPRAI